MAKTSLKDVKEEVICFLRSSDILTTSQRGVTTKTDTGTFTTASTYTLSTSPTLVKNVRSVTVAGSALKLGHDYSVNYTSGVITFVSPQSGAYSIPYDYGTSDRLFPDYPEPDLDLSMFPRVGMGVISGTSKEFEIGAAMVATEYIISIVSYSPDQDTVETMVDSIRAAILNNKKNFYNAPFVTVTGIGPLIPSPFGKGAKRIMQRNVDIKLEDIYES